MVLLASQNGLSATINIVINRFLQVKYANGNMAAGNESCNQSGFGVAVREH
jgi:hypothetical protein